MFKPIKSFLSAVKKKNKKKKKNSKNHVTVSQTFTRFGNSNMIGNRIKRSATVFITLCFR